MMSSSSDRLSNALLLALLCSTLALVVSSANAFYDPTTGRWLSRDPLGDEFFLTQYAKGKPFEEQVRLRWESLKMPYSFVDNAPVNSVDPRGLSTVRISTGIGVVILTDPSISQFREAIRGLPDGAIRRIEIVGHGSWDQMLIEPGGSGHGILFVLGLTPQVTFSDDGSSVADLLRPKLGQAASVALNGCNTAREGWGLKTNIARQLSAELPEINVEGNRGFGLGNELSNPFNRDHRFRFGKENHAFGIIRSYLNGQ